MTKIEKIEWIDEDIKEADVTISDGTYSVICFACPFILHENDLFQDRISCLDVEYVLKAFESNPIVEKRDDAYSYFLRGKLIDRENKIIKIGEIEIDISDADVPGDIREGDIIEFIVSRLDILR